MLRVNWLAVLYVNMSHFNRIMQDLDDLKNELRRLQATRDELKANLALFRVLRDQALHTRYIYREIHEVYSADHRSSGLPVDHT